MLSNRPKGISDFLFWTLGILVSILYYRGFFWLDDSRIIFQVVENMYHGYGPVYTAGDRVQVHTSPLWTYYLLFFRLFTSSYKVVIFLSAILPLLGIISWFRVKYRPYSFVLLAILFLSNVLFSFWGSGLDNPLTYALLTLLIYSFSKENIKWFVFISALLLVNRFDAIFYVAPLSVWFIRKHSIKQNLISFFKYGWPFYGQLIFSFLYYGSIFPNTFYAKVTSINITISERVVSAAKYLLPIILHSPLDLVFILSPFLLFFLLRKKLHGPTRKKLQLGLVAGLFNLFYVFWIGFDHLNPRLLGVPLFLGLLVIFEFFAPLIHQEIKAFGKKALAPTLVSLIGVMSIAAFSTFLPIKKLKFMRDKDDGKNPEYYQQLRMSEDSYIFSDIQIVCSEYRVINTGDEKNLRRPDSSPHIVSFVAEAGTILEVGTDVHMVDIMGLADPLMARIRSTQPYYNPGHNFRPIPRGYPETLMEGTNQILHPELANYYNRLKNVISGKLLSANRFRDIFYLATHAVPVDPNDPESTRYFLTPDEYIQIFEEDYGIYKQINEFGDEFKFYSLDGIKSEGFSTEYWRSDKLNPTDSLLASSEQLFEYSPSGEYDELLTNGPDINLRPGKYTYELDYSSSDSADQTSAKWVALVTLGEDDNMVAKEGSLSGTKGETKLVTDTFSIKPNEDMGRFSIRIFGKGDSTVIINGLRLTKLSEPDINNN